MEIGGCSTTLRVEARQRHPSGTYSAVFSAENAMRNPTGRKVSSRPRRTLNYSPWVCDRHCWKEISTARKTWRRKVTRCCLPNHQGQRKPVHDRFWYSMVVVGRIEDGTRRDTHSTGKLVIILTSDCWSQKWPAESF